MTLKSFEQAQDISSDSGQLLVIPSDTQLYGHLTPVSLDDAGFIRETGQPQKKLLTRGP